MTNEKTESVSQFSLFGQQRFLPLFIAQFFGAFNDNLFKAGLFTIFTTSTVLLDSEKNLYNNIAAAVLVIPFFLFSSTAGNLADVFEKSRLVRTVKFAEVLIALLIVFALYTKNPWVLLGVVFLLGTQSAFFGPLKFSILPQHLNQAELTGGNGLMAMGTLVAILLGLIIGPLMTDPGFTFFGFTTASEGIPWIFTGVIAIAAIVGLLFALLVPKTPSNYQGQTTWNPFRDTYRLFRLASEKKAVLQSIFGISWFWALGAVYTTNFAKLTTDHLYAQTPVYSLLLGTVILSIAIGCVACEWLSRKRIEIGLVPIGALLVSIFGVEFYYAITAIAVPVEPRSIGEFLTTASSYRVLVDIVLLGFFLGLYLVPLQTLVQARTPVDRRARVIAANNVLNAIFVTLASVLAIVWLTVLEWSIPTLMLFFACFNVCVAIYIFVQVPEFTLRFVVWILSHTLYRIRHDGLNHVPDRGAAMITCNHVSYIDALVLMGAIRRPIRFVMSKGVFDIPVLNYLFRAAKTIPIASKVEDRETYDQAFVEIQHAIDQGDLLCIFPEGRLTPDGEVGEFKGGMLKVLKTNPIPVIPAALCGFWGSKFTHYGKGLWQGPLQLWSKLEVKLTEPMDGASVDLSVLRNRVMDLRGSRQ